MNFDYLSSGDYEQWNAFVDGSPEGSIYAKTWYLDAVGCPYRIGVVRKGDNWLGGIVLTTNEIRTSANPLFVKYLGIVYADFEGKYYNRMSQKLNVAEKITGALKDLSTFDYTFHPSFSNWMPFYWAGFRQETRYTFQIRNVSFDQAQEQFKQTTRTQERKARNQGIIIDTRISPDRVYDLLAKTFQKQGGPPPYSRKKFVAFYSKLSVNSAIELTGAFREDELHAVTGIVYDRKSANLLFNGVDPEHNSSAANTLLIAETIRSGLDKSELFDFEGSMIKPVERFYRGFGGELVSYYNIWKPSAINCIKRAALRLYKKIRYGR